MTLPEERIRVVAASPIELDNRRLLPSVLVSTVQGRWPNAGLLRIVRMRPVSVVVEDEEGATWHEIPNATSDALSTMAAIGMTIAGASLVVILLARWLKRK
jgi:hypothetical protein